MDLAHLLHRSAMQFPERPLWVTPETSIPYAEAARRANRIATSLLQGGQQRDRVAILSVNRFEHFEMFLAALNAGMAATPFNPKLHVDELSFMIEDSTPAFFVFSPEFAVTVKTLRARHTCVQHWICMDPVAGFEYYGNLMEGVGDARPDLLIDPDEVAWLFYTSGTTGKPKGCMETHRNLVNMVTGRLLSILSDVDETDRIIHFAPMAHATTSVGLSHLARGAAQIFPGLEKFDPPKVLEAVERFGATSSFMAPTMVQMLLNCPDLESYNVKTLKNILCGGGPLYAEVLRRAIEVFGPIIGQGYGQSEAPSGVCGMHKSEYDLNSPDGLGKLGSVGRESLGVRVRIVDEHGKEVAPNVAGEITVRGDIVFPGYWRRKEATDEVLKNGWLHTGDVGYRDDRGYIFITDRVKDMIISGGSNIYPREVEEVLLQHEAIAEACVVGVPDGVWGEAVQAVVVLRENAAISPDDVIEFCRSRLASYKKPKAVDFVDHLPKNAYGKILKKEVKARYWQSATGAI
ncbi:Long-chain-fatty-acid--CoA ligase FadD13 [Paraburkholderia sediminicola]|uniref:Long-chain-fatty-acid--CoA ligase FadD13 n=1 Tax=Paraburkholderia sediminicola TaxID=458836 RepID=A0A6J5CUT7_9BURK|nr:AMP-binding protein [Paraburkholderia sediminicola]CAB3744127.1 Long-chain-fatty-acid--CoA ligase FadD13 [Paraburkholderia sediminicola]